MNLSALDLNLLLVFEALLLERGVSAAARRLGLGQPGTSAALGRLRAILGDELFVRSGGEMRPTAKALELAPGIVAALSGLRHTFEAGIDFEPGAASRGFALGSTDYTSLVLLPPLVAHLRRRAPGVDLHVIGYEKGTVAEMLDRGRWTWP
ncbi:LysR family transcriptional regulator [Roseomonas sp. CCTCC AB2023176]|uniref:LysR family transcriptional regulator n=1 Tax=Roseomonas sp. CCTCC AB2023176 TaxID=3342640 RepID=UPI0035D6355F